MSKIDACSHEYQPLLERLSMINRKKSPSGPSLAFKKWSGHAISKTFYEGRRHELGGSGGLSRENFIFPDIRTNDFNVPWDNFCP